MRQIQLTRSTILFGALMTSVVGAVASVTLIATTQSASAIPVFARQTGQPCGNCHTDFLGLTPFGRRFKLGGYTLGGGPFRTPLLSQPKSAKIFPSVDDFRSVLVPGESNAKADANAKVGAKGRATDAEAALRSYAAETAGSDKTRVPRTVADSFAAVDSDDKGWMPPVAVMLIAGYTHTQRSDPNWVAGGPLKPNDNVSLAQASLFGGGAITDNIGAFAQLTYGGPAMGDTRGTWGWDNVDVRFANTGQIGGVDVLYGITAHNNPTVQDVWNTAPAWSVPYFSTQLGFQGPGATPILDGQFGMRVGGVGGYLFINDMLYLEATGYRTLGYSATRRLGADPLGGLGQFNGVAPYGRIALEQRFGDHNLMVGAVAMQADVRPWLDPTGVTSTDTMQQTNRYTDVGIDTQYQYRGDDWWFIARGSYIQERQSYYAGIGSLVSIGGELVNAANDSNKLDTLRLSATLAYGGDNRLVLTGMYFDIKGTADAGLYGGNPGFSPNTNGYMAELAYIPFGVTRAPYWPWFNTRMGLQYFYYNKIDGDSIAAHDKNTLILYSTILF